MFDFRVRVYIVGFLVALNAESVVDEPSGADVGWLVAFGLLFVLLVLEDWANRRPTLTVKGAREVRASGRVNHRGEDSNG